MRLSDYGRRQNPRGHPRLARRSPPGPPYVQQQPAQAHKWGKRHSSVHIRAAREQVVNHDPATAVTWTACMQEGGLGTRGCREWDGRERAARAFLLTCSVVEADEGITRVAKGAAGDCVSCLHRSLATCMQVRSAAAASRVSALEISTGLAKKKRANYF